MKFDEIKKMSAWEILKFLQKKTRRNANLIKENSQIIQSVLKGEVELDAGRYNIAKVQSENNELIKENSEYLKLHNQLLSFMRSVQDDVLQDGIVELESELKVEKPNKEPKEFTFDEMFEKTIAGLVEFNSDHPFYDSEEFRKQLLKYYTEHEEYEKCALLVKK